MADDGMLLNFQLGPEPLKRQVKFTGGRWRDRKRAERSAREAAGDAPSPRPPRDDRPPRGGGDRPYRRRDDDRDFGDRPPKRQRYDDNGNGPNFDPYKRPRQNDPNFDPYKKQPGGFGGGPRRDGPPGGKHDKNRQVVSRLFSFNPSQKTEEEQAERDEDGKKKEWTAPEASNAPLASVANFGTLSLASRLVDELGKMGLERPTAIQNKVIPHLLEGSGDAFVQAETGSGKTFAYLLPMLHRVLQLTSPKGKVHRDSGVFGIVVSPTRELARQTHTVLEQLLRPFPWLVSTAITGGESKKAEKARIRKGVNFLVATPGRLADHIDNTKALSLGTVRWLVLDEGDRLMDLGFEEDLKKAIGTLRRVDVARRTADGAVLLDGLPDRRVSVLCSATMKMNVQRLGEMSLADATFLAVDSKDMADDPTAATKTEGDDDVHRAPAQLHQSHLIVPAKLRLVTLLSYLRSVFSRRGKTMKVIVFMSCADSVDFHYELLRDPKRPEAQADAGDSTEAAPTAAATREAELVSKTVSRAAYVTTPASPEVVVHRMHGSLTQPVRTATIKSFSACRQPSVLVTTDVSSRGLDIPSVDLVIEYDPAFSFPDHIHRVGRTARAGRSGDAVLFLLPGPEEGYISLLRASASTPPTAASYETVMRDGLARLSSFPVETSAQPPAPDASSHSVAEALQLHVEQRVLADARLLELARNGFKSHIRAYATHVKDERVHFDMAELHLGHTAKSFGLREAPGGIGNGVDRKAKRKGAAAKAKGPGKDGGKGAGARSGGGDEGDGAVDSRAAQDLLRKKSMMLMNAGADEFNIG